MSMGRRSAGTFALAFALTCGALGTGCVHHYYRAYDPYYNDYHTWNDREIGYYHQWARETHRDPDRDFRKLPPDDQTEYWKWRHAQDDRHHH
jgi:hypothetical protein